MNPSLSLKFCTLLLFALISSSSFGQSDNENPYANLPFKERLFFGGDLGLAFGTITSIRLAPLVGYNINPKLSVGISPSYEYYKDKRPTPDYESTVYGGSAFARYFVLPSIFLQASPEVLNLEKFPIININGDYTYSNDRVTIPVLLLGGGFSQRTPNGSGFFIGAYYDIIQDEYSPYSNNFVFRLGGMISL